MSALRLNSQGPNVKTLQEALKRAGYQVPVNGVFGTTTYTGLRKYQLSKGLLPDGIAGSKTLQHLGITFPGIPPHKVTKQDPVQDMVKRLGVYIAQAAVDAMRIPNRSLETAKSPKLMNISEKGLKFIFTEESLPGVSNHLHWPGGSSGVTLGAGYDMKERNSSEIESDMKAIGLASEVASKVASGAKKTGKDALDFVTVNKKLVNLESKQEFALLKQTAEKYVAIIRRNFHASLVQWEFDALVSFAYNPGGSVRPVAHLIDKGEVCEAMKAIARRVITGRKTSKGLLHRREAEIKLYLYGEYGCLRNP